MFKCLKCLTSSPNRPTRYFANQFQRQLNRTNWPNSQCLKPIALGPQHRPLLRCIRKSFSMDPLWRSTMELCSMQRIQQNHIYRRVSWVRQSPDTLVHGIRLYRMYNNQGCWRIQRIRLQVEIALRHQYNKLSYPLKCKWKNSLVSENCCCCGWYVIHQALDLAGSTSQRSIDR